MAIRMHPPKQPDLVQRHLMTIEWQVCASPDYLKKHGTPQRAEDLDAHRLVLFGDYHPPVPDINWLAEAGRRPGNPRRASLEVNSLRPCCSRRSAGLGIAALPDYLHAGERRAGAHPAGPEGTEGGRVTSSIRRSCAIRSASRCSATFCSRNSPNEPSSASADPALAVIVTRRERAMAPVEKVALFKLLEAIV